jgi:RNA polymerase sigma-70 factor (ECF subfamily)
LRKESDYRFEWAVLRHLDAAYNLARWLLGNDQDAEDVVQDAAIRAHDSLKTFRGTNGKAWFLTIVRNVSFNHLRKRSGERSVEVTIEEVVDLRAPDPEQLVIQAWEAEVLRSALDDLPVVFREIVVLRELEDMSYKEIATVTGLPMGTVMSRLARARQRLQASLHAWSQGERQ